MYKNIREVNEGAFLNFDAINFNFNKLSFHMQQINVHHHIMRTDTLF